MIKREFDLRLDIKGKPINSYATFTNGDVEVNYFNISLFSNSEPLSLQGVNNILISFKRSDGTVVVGNKVDIINASMGQLSYKLGTSEIEKAGKVEATISFYGLNKEKLTSAVFYFNVVAQIYSEEAISSQNEYPILTDLINQVGSLKPNMWLIGEGEAGDIGRENDLYLNTSNGSIYRKTNEGIWQYISTLIQQNTGVSLPSGGTTGQVLTKASDKDGEAVWTTIQMPEQKQELPAGGKAGEVLTKTTNGVEWKEINIPKPIARHEELEGLQGGKVGEHYHLTLEEKNKIRKITFMELEPEETYGEDGEIIIIYE